MHRWRRRLPPAHRLTLHIWQATSTAIPLTCIHATRHRKQHAIAWLPRDPRDHGPTRSSVRVFSPLFDEHGPTLRARIGPHCRLQHAHCCVDSKHAEDPQSDDAGDSGGKPASDSKERSAHLPRRRRRRRLRKNIRHQSRFPHGHDQYLAVAALPSIAKPLRGAICLRLTASCKNPSRRHTRQKARIASARTQMSIPVLPAAPRLLPLPRRAGIQLSLSMEVRGRLPGTSAAQGYCHHRRAAPGRIPLKRPGSLR